MKTDGVIRNGSGERAAPAVQMKDVSVVFAPKKSARVQALDRVSLDVPRGAFISLIGPSGCGKSTLLRVLADLVQPESGSVQVLGCTPAESRENRSYGFAFQQATLFEWRTVRKNIELPLALSGMAKDDRARLVDRMLELVKLEDFGNHRPSQLSGGMQQRVAIARALSFEPEILLMDEPFGALDEIAREHLQNELLRIWRETGTTIVFVTHSIPEAVFLSTEVVVMTPRPGKIHRIVDVPFGPERTQETRDSSAFFAKVGEVRQALRSEGVL
jgi:NitT/TauT family transport system ATP-binding protein